MLAREDVEVHLHAPQIKTEHFWLCVHTLLCNPVCPRQFCALPSGCLELWQRQQLNVCMPHIICSGHAWCPGHYLTTSVLPLLKAMHHVCLFSWYYTYSIHLHQLAVDFHWCTTHLIQKSKHASYFKVCHGSSRPSIFNLIYLWYPLSCTMTQSTCSDYMLKYAVP